MKLFSANTKDIQASCADVDNLRIALDIERRVSNALPKTADRSIDQQLTMEFKRRLRQTEGYLARLEDLFRNATGKAA
jgi:ferritin-like metal-binding protein YciE